MNAWIKEVLAQLDLNSRPWGTDERKEIEYNHSILGLVHTTPFSSRSTYAYCVEYGDTGPVRKYILRTERLSAGL